MKKIFVCAVFALLSFSAFSQITRDAAYEILKNSCLNNNYSNYEILASTEVVPSSDTIYTNNTYVVSPSYPCWFFFVDLDPYADWWHACRYVFVSVETGECVSTNMQSPPEYNMDMMHQVVDYSPFSDDDIFKVLPTNA